MLLHDRFMRGFIAGIVAAIVMDILNYISSILNIAELTYWQWASVLIYGYRTTNTFEIFLALVMQVAFSGVIGILFSYLLILTKSTNYIFKGIIYSFFVWFTTNAIVFMYKVTPLIPVKGDTIASNIVTATIYGIVLAETLRWMDNRISVE